MRLLRNNHDQTLEFGYNREDEPEEDRLLEELEQVEAEANANEILERVEE